jgi:hypothetical protein
MAGKGEVDAALQLHQERLAVYQGLGDQAGLANTLWSIAKIELERQEFQEAARHLFESYQILMKVGRLNGICSVGLDLGQLLCHAGQADEGRAILTRSRDGFIRLGRPDMVQHVEALLDQFMQHSSASAGDASS